MAVFCKDPDAIVDYEIDWASAYLAGQTIAASSWMVTGGAPTDAGAPDVLASLVSGGVTRVTLRGGVAGRVYRITNRITLSDGRRDERSLTVRVEPR